MAATPSETTRTAPEPDPLETHCPGLDPEIEPIVLRALAKDPKERYQDLGHLRRDIRRVRARLEIEGPRFESGTTVIVGAPLPILTPPRTPRRGSDRVPRHATHPTAPARTSVHSRIEPASAAQREIAL